MILQSAQPLSLIPAVRLVLAVTAASGALTTAARAGELIFADPILIPTPGGATEIELADMDGDGDPDIVALEVVVIDGEVTGMLNVVLNHGGGSFGDPFTLVIGTTFNFESSVSEVAIGEYDNDGDNDVAVIGTLIPVTFAFNNGDGTLGDPIPTGEQPDITHLLAVIDAGDLNGDGVADVMYGQPGRIGISDGDGGFDFADLVDDSSARNLEFVDLDDDGDNDIAYGTRTYINDGTGSFVQTGSYPGGAAPDCAFADFDGDGAPDAACAVSALIGAMRISLGAGDGTFEEGFESVFVGLGPRTVRIGDLDRDGELDLAVAYVFGDADACAPDTCFSVLRGNGDGTFEAPEFIVTPTGGTMAVGDLDADGDDDIVLSTGHFFEVGSVSVLLNDGTEPITGDLDGDGIVNVIDLLILLGSWGPCEGCAADLNADGQVDVTDLLILLANYGSAA